MSLLSYLFLNPKCVNPFKLGDFRLIYLVGCVYNIIIIIIIIIVIIINQSDNDICSWVRKDEILETVRDCGGSKISNHI